MSWRALRLAGLLACIAACAEDEAEEPSTSDESPAASRDRDAGADGSTAPSDAARDAARSEGGARADGAPRDADLADSHAEETETSRRDAARPGDASASSDAGACPFAGKLSYTLARAPTPTADQTSAYEQIARSMDTALDKYNCYTDIVRAISVTYDPGVATADGNVNGSIRFGSRASMNFVTAMHELSHTLGVGGNEFRARVQDRIFTGASATRQLREISGAPQDVVHSDGTHFWPHGLNYETEFTAEVDALNHCKMVMAIRADLGL